MIYQSAGFVNFACESFFWKVKGRAYTVWEVRNFFRRLIIFDVNLFSEFPYGDQGLFMSKTIYKEVGGFPPYPLMEDYILVSMRTL